MAGRPYRALLIYCCTLSAWATFRYVTGYPSHYSLPFRDKYIAHLGVLWLHGVPAILALFLGPLQFWNRTRSPALHRVLGLLYMISVFTAAATGFDMGLRAYGGAPSQIGFCVMSVLWAGTAAMAWRYAARGQIAEHQKWMLRNFTLTFGAVLLRVLILAVKTVGLDYAQAYPWVTWLAWVPTLLAVEAYLAWQPTRRRAHQVPRQLSLHLTR